MAQVIGTSLGDPTATVAATLASGSTVTSPHPALHVAEREMIEALRLNGLGNNATASAVVYSATFRTRRPVTNATEMTWTCDGTNDEAEINAAILAVANEGGGCVQLLGPLFNIGASITLRTGVWLKGEGLGTILRASSGFGAGVVTLFDNTTHATTLSHLTIDGASSSVYGVHYSQSGGEVFSSPDPDTNPDPAHIIEKLFIRACGSASSPMAGMRMQGGNLRAGKYSNIRILACSNGVWVDGAVDSVYHDIEVGSSGNNATVNYSTSTTSPVGHGFFINGDQNMFSHCHAWFSRGAGYYARATRLQFVGCSAQDNHSAGFHGAFGKNVYTGCIADSNGQAVGADTRLRSGFYFTSDLNNIQGCTSFDRGQASHTWVQQYGFQITGGFTYSRLEGVTYGNELAGFTGTVPASSQVNVLVDSTGK